ncbi:unnamed protein product [Caenorhabditis bovis]|uniref:DUF7083 domain-containing protein n=1 Tax=Caenorhabditis bovis TaxID=2654633 RepID=A0A8S1FBT9_9PELO|nr:unnamed protein product [Caenorhabditis bovis]
MDKETITQFLKQQAEQQRIFQQQQQQFQQQQQEFLKAISAAFTTQKQQPDVTNIINSLSNRISTFHYCPDDGETFDAWFGRYHDIIEIDGKDLDDATRTRIVVSKLENKEAEQFRSFILPKTPADVNFNDTIATLKKLFNQTKSLARLRYELFSVKFDGVDRKDYTALVKRRFAAAQWNQLSSDQAECLLWIIGLHASEHLDLRIRALRELELNPEMKLTELTDRLDQVISLRADADFIGGGSHDIHAIHRQASKPKPKFRGGSRSKNARTPTSPRTSATSPPSQCSRCGGSHWKRDCKLPQETICHSCQKTGHLSKFDRHHGARHRAYEVGDAVFVKDYRSKQTWSPGIIIRRLGAVTYIVNCQGNQWHRHANQLRRRDHQNQRLPLHIDFDLPMPIRRPSTPTTVPTQPTVASTGNQERAPSTPTIPPVHTRTTQGPPLRRSSRNTREPRRLILDPRQKSYL